MDLFATLLELIGVALVVLAAWFVSPVLGLFALGGALIIIGYLLERD